MMSAISTDTERPLRIVELGGTGLFFVTHPATTTLLWTGEEDPPQPFPDNLGEFNLAAGWRLLRDARRGAVDLVVAYFPTRHPPWHWRPLRSLVHRPFAPWRRLVRLFGMQALRLLPRAVPIFVVDFDDMRTIARHNLFLLDRCKYYFKRELPIDRWQVFQGTAHPVMPSTRFRARARNRRRIETIYPWAIGFSSDQPRLPEASFPEKTIDVFVATGLNSATARIQGLTELKALAAQGVRIFFPESRLPHDEYMRVMSQSWITWSPEGFGWDCIRHYEAPAAHSVPLMNRPTIVRCRPMMEGTHALFYDADLPGSLAQVIREALRDPARLKTMALAARQHVAEHHLRPWSQSDALLRYARGVEQPPGGIRM